MIDTLTILFSSTLTDYTEIEQELYLLDMIDKLTKGIPFWSTVTYIL